MISKEEIQGWKEEKIIMLPKPGKGLGKPVELFSAKDVFEKRFCVEINGERGCYSEGILFFKPGRNYCETKELPPQVKSIVSSVSREREEDPYHTDYIKMYFPVENLHEDYSKKTLIDKLLEVGISRKVAEKMAGSFREIGQSELRLFRGVLGSENGLIPFAAITGAEKEIRDGVLVRKVILGINELTSGV